MTSFGIRTVTGILSWRNLVCTVKAVSYTHLPGPLLDRMEIIELSSYMEEEKLEIAKRYFCLLYTSTVLV